MRLRRCATAALLATILSAALVRAQAPAAALTNADVLRLIAMHVSDTTVIAVIREAAATTFDLEAATVEGLVKQHVSGVVIAAMRQVSAQAKASPASEPHPSAATAAGARSLAEAAAEAAAKRRDSANPAFATAPASTGGTSAARPTGRTLGPDWNAQSPRNRCISSLVGDSLVPESAARGACEVDSSQEFYICVYQTLIGAPVDSGIAINACLKNKSKAFWNCVYQNSRELNADKRKAIDHCLATGK